MTWSVSDSSQTRSAHESAKRSTLEMKHFVRERRDPSLITTIWVIVDDGMFLQMKITLITCQKKNTSTTRTNGGFIQISKVLIPCHWGIDLISSKHCLPFNDYTKKQEKNHTCLLIPTSTNNGSWHRVHLLHGGIGKVPGGILIIQKVKKEVSQVLSERGDPFLAVFGKTLRKWLSRFQFISLQLDRLQLTTVYCNRREV